MKKLSDERMDQLQGGCTCSGVGICCEHWNLSWIGGGDWAVCFGCDGSLAYIEAW
jgi:hypothetical protein